MIIPILTVLPFVAALAVWLLRGRFCRTIMVVAAVAVEALTVGLFVAADRMISLGGITLGIADAADPGLTVLFITATLLLFVSLHLCVWLKADRRAGEIAGHSRNMSDHALIALLLLFAGTMNLTALAQDFGMLWVAVEATTLASAPLINFHRSKSSLEAMWKYLLLCSLGIGLALFGTMLLSASLPEGSPLDFAGIGAVDPRWFKAAFVFCFAGYGLKAGLAPFHFWLPDAHSEAPAPVSAMLSGCLLNCAMLALLRVRGAAPVELQGFCSKFFILFGMLSLLIAACFIIHQRDFKRMLAYSSVEHMGLIALMFGFAVESAASVHMFFHSLTKMMMFLLAGNLLLAYGTRRIDRVSGLWSRLSRNSKLWLLGMLMICGTPPSPLFFTEWALVREAGLLWGAVILLLLLVIFCAMADIVLKMFSGTADKPVAAELDAKVERLTVVPAAAMVIICMCGVLFLTVLVNLAR